MARALLTTGQLPPFFAFSAFLDTSLTIDFMRLGALNVFDKRVDAADIAKSIVLALENGPPRPEPLLAFRPGQHRNAAAYGLAILLVGALGSEDDMPSLDAWARAAAASESVPYSSRSVLYTSCDRVGLAPHDVRDFTAPCAPSLARR